ncbi:MAG TPA: NAD-dependent epimerase/dehydratase family protein [Steroidobacteraceae bacterium]
MQGAEPKLALLAGASGLSGGYALDALLEAADIRRVLAVSRRPLGREHPRLANRIVQFERLEAQLKGASCDVALCCLGTTIREAGSQERFRAVDIDCVLAFARAARAANAQRFVVISSVGADPGARNFYLRTKGEMEQRLVEAGFESLDILQPSLLLGWRGEMRPLELAARAFMPLVNPLLRGRYIPFRAIAARTVGAAMLGATRSGRRGVQRYTYEGIGTLARLAGARTRAPAQPKAPARAR